MTETLDLIVIGAGMAGINAAKKCSQAGWSVAIVDELPYGGTCALRGCDPKKMLRAGAEAVEAVRLLEGKGVAGETKIDWPSLMKHKESFTDPVPESMESGLTEAGVKTLHGRARFTAKDRIEIDGQGEIAFRRALIATGAKPRPLEFSGAERLIDSTDFLNLAELPRRIVFVGGGYISFEFAHIAARAGAEVTILDRGARQLKMFDPDLVEMLLERSREAGIEIMAEAEMERIGDTDGAHRVLYRKAGQNHSIEADLVVHGAGRVPDIDHLDLAAAGIETEHGGVKVAAWLQSPSNPRIYAAGDAAASPGKPLTPVAVFEGKDYRVNGPGRHKTMTLKTDEFIRRFLIHVLPKGQHRIRHYGFYGNGNRVANIARIRQLLGATTPDQDHANDDSLGDEPPRVLALPCPCCGGHLIIVETIAPEQHPRAPPGTARAAA